MNYLLLFLLPIVMGGVCFMMRNQQGFVLGLAIATTALMAWIAWHLPIERPVSVVGVSITVQPINRLFMIAFAAGLGVTFVAATRVAHGENFVTIGLLILGLLSGILLIDVQAPFLITLLLLATGLAIVLALVDLPLGSPALLRGRTIGTGLKYLVLMLLAGMLLALCFVLADLESIPDRAAANSFARPLLALLIVGIGLRLAAIPFHSWLPDVLEDAPPLVGVLVGVVNIGALLFLVSAFQFLIAPGLLTITTTSVGMLRVFALVSAVGGGLLALQERSLRRFLAMLLISDMGVMLFGVVSTTAGLTGALFQAFNQIVLGVILFTSVALLERPEPTRPAAGDGLLRRRPWASGVFIGAVLALLGMPPFNGFASKALIYQGAAERGWGYLAAMLVATALGAYAFARILKDQFLGRAPEAVTDPDDITDFRGLGLPPPPPQRSEPIGPTGLVVALLAVCVGIGVYPQVVLGPIVEAVRSLTFVQFL